ncbi:MAG: Gfo/Idh/MocA family oxidoreductase, partial [Planctomycetes bacterium]|nr:Gfo/Idh/MocA family oxidoreductase [Planctomycetota bacterium]
MKSRKVALAGLTRTGLDYLDILRDGDLFEVVAVADSDPAVLRECDIAESVSAYEDYRSLIVESAHSGLDLLVVATEPHQSSEFLPLAVERGIPVFHKPPFARSLQEGRSLVARFEAADCPFLISREWHHDGWPTGADMLENRAGYVHTAVGQISIGDEPGGWRGDSLRAGGGVLLHGAYVLVDLLVTLMGVPDSVYAVCSFARAPGETRNYDTEDNALLLMRWGANRAATLVARRGGRGGAAQVTLVGTNDTLVWSAADTSGEGGGGKGRQSTASIAFQIRSAAGIGETVAGR